MITRLILIVIFLLKAATTIGQVYIKTGISTEESIGLMRSLAIKMEDTARVDILLPIADYHLWKSSDAPSDLDSAARFINQATAINSPKRDGLVSYYEAWLARRKGNTDAGKQLINKAITQLKAKGDEFHRK